MGVFETLKKYKWMLPLINKADRETKSTLMKNFRKKKQNFYPKKEVKANIDDLIKCMLCPNMCRFDCGTLQATQTETMSPAYKARIGYFLSIGKIDPSLPENKEFIDLMYKCTNEENCKVWCPFDFSVVSLLETVRDDINDQGLMPEYCKKQIEKIKSTKTIEDYNIYKTYEEKKIENIETDGKDEVFYYIGCETMKFPAVVNANIELLTKAGVKFSTNLDKRVCCGAPILNIRDIDLAKELAQENIELIKKTGAKVIISDCPGCVLTLTKRYKDIGFKIDKPVIHIAEFLKDLIEDGKLKPGNTQEKLRKVTIHDPCLLARNLNDVISIRSILESIPNVEIVDPIYSKEYTHCCGWSGTTHWADKDIAIKEASNRIEELMETGAKIIVSACPLCELGLDYGIKNEDREKIKIFDISELLIKSI
ncbi:MAG: (Fe-S)-binding protein [Promethearchaeota archaeon]|nr:MAG: (Fe-S)-binding protein [Candidatus Lokiarchaeota archaeon]